MTKTPSKSSVEAKRIIYYCKVFGFASLPLAWMGAMATSFELKTILAALLSGGAVVMLLALGVVKISEKNNGH